MSVTVTHTMSGSGITLTDTKTFSPSDEGVVSATCSITTGTTDKVWSVGGIDVSQLVAVMFTSDRAVTLETNANDATGGNTITLAANVPYLWCTGKPDTCKLTADILSTIYVTNASGATATVKAFFVMDSTP